MMVNKKYVTIESYGKINILGGIRGPITSPCYLDINVIIALINAGKAVYEVNPENTEEKTRLTRMNVLNTIYKPKSSTVKTTAKKSSVVKTSDVKSANTKTEPTGVETEVVQDTEKSLVGIDMFISNKHT